MKTITLFLVLVITGCTHPVFPRHYEKGIELCASNGGLKSLNVGPVFFDVTCNNGAQFIDIPKITKSEGQ